jgi:hypothetical protein
VMSNNALKTILSAIFFFVFLNPSKLLWKRILRNVMCGFVLLMFHYSAHNGFFAQEPL